MASFVGLIICATLINHALSSTTCDCSTSCSSEYDDFIYCKSVEACASADLESTKALYCTGNEGCEDANIVSDTFATTVYCWGYEGCLNADIDLENTQNFLKCDGYQSCKSATINNEKTTTIPSIGNAIYCQGRYGCQSASITTDYYVYCDGDYACEGTSITSTNGQSDSYTRIYCDGNYGCSTIDINSASAMYCRGYYSCYDTDIQNVDYISGQGFYALRDAVIDSDGLSTLDVYLYGYKAGYNLQIICRDGVDCNIGCDGYGCQNTEIIYCDYSDVSFSDINPGFDISVACKLSMFQDTYYQDSVWCPTLTKDCTPSVEKLRANRKLKEDDRDLEDTDQQQPVQEQLNAFAQDAANIKLVESVKSVDYNTFKGVLIGLFVGWITAIFAVWCFVNHKNETVQYEPLK